jgi:hypothetical protein
MDARTLARTLAYGRIVLGASLVLDPGRSARGWVGDDGTTPGARVMAVALGARDVAIGAGTARAVSRGSGEHEWIVASVLCDAADFAATFSRRGALPKTGAIGVSALAGSATLVGLWLWKELG